MISSPSCSALPVDARAVDEHAVEAAVVEQPHAVGLAHDQRVAARDGRVVEAQVGGEAAADARPLARQRDRAQLAALLVDEVLARLLDALARACASRCVAVRGAGGSNERRLVGCARSPCAMRSVLLNSDARTNSLAAAARAGGAAVRARRA